MHDALLSRLPSHHIARPRLAERCGEERLVVLEAAGGYGKSVLAAELVDAWGAVPIWVSLEAGSVPAALFAARLRAAVASAGLTDASGAMASAGEDPPAVIDAMLAALRLEAYAIVLDDVHRAQADAAALIDRLADGMTAPGRLVVLARHLPAGLERLRRAEALVLSAQDLALRSGETLELCQTGFALQVSTEDARLLDVATGGWTAAAVLAASRAKRAGQPLSSVARPGGAQVDSIRAILDEALSSSGHERTLFAQIAAPPLLDRELLAQITGQDDFLERALAWGLPMTEVDGGWWSLPDPVREHLAEPGAVEPDVLRIAAGHYRRRRELGRALLMLIAAGDADSAAALLDSSDPWMIETVDAVELLSILDAIPDLVLDRHPQALLHVARCFGGSWMMAHSNALLARADALVDGTRAPELRRAVDVELLVEPTGFGDHELVERGARRLLAAVGPDEQLTRARALTMLGRSLCGRGRRDDEGKIDAALLLEARDCLQRATAIQLSLGNRLAAATITIYWALWVEVALGRYDAALEVLGSGLELTAEHPRRFAQILFCRAHALVDLGRPADVEADLEQTLQIGHRLSDPWMVGYVAWERMRSASVVGDGEATLRHAREASSEGQGSWWWEYDGSEFLADAADCLDRVGHVPLAIEYLERSRAMSKQSEPDIAMTEGALLARHGDPALARELLAQVEHHGIAPREYWRATLLDAYAAFRQGDGAAGALAARAFEQAAGLGQPQAPLLRERELTESLLPVAVQTGLPAARSLESASLPAALAVLGRFQLTMGGREVVLRDNQEARLLKLVAVSAAGIHVEQVIETLWPDTELTAGRNRLRTVLSRLHGLAPGVVVRDGELLTIGSDTVLDLGRFRGEAMQAQALRQGDRPAAVALARSAIARYRGPLLPADPYEPWTQKPRESSERTMLEMLDLCAEAAAENGDLDEARRIVERTIELAPYDDDRYLKVAIILHQQGRKGAALTVLRRARAALAQLGIDPPAPLITLEQRIATASPRQADIGSLTRT